MAARIIQFQAPSARMLSMDRRSPARRKGPSRRARALAGWRLGLTRLAATPNCRRSPKASRAISATPAMAPITDVASSGRISTFWFLRLGQRLQRADIVVGDEIVDRLHVAFADRLADHLRRLGLGFRRALARLGVAIGRLAAALGGEDLRLLGAFGGQDRRLPLALGHEDRRALVALGLHLPRHRVDQVARRLDVLDLDAGDLDAPIVRSRRRPP